MTVDELIRRLTLFKDSQGGDREVGLWIANKNDFKTISIIAPSFTYYATTVCQFFIEDCDDLMNIKLDSPIVPYRAPLDD